MTPLARIGLDIGGTFTDVALEIGDQRHTAKVLTTPSAPEEGAMQALRLILELSRLRPGDVGEIIHGTTLATNALIARSGARTALITTSGFRDTIEIGTEGRPDQYDLNVVKPPPLVPRRHRFPVKERLDSQGRVLVALDPGEIRALGPRLVDAGIEAVAIGFLHSYVNPQHEQIARDVLLDTCPDLMVTLSGEVSPEFREFERISTACANAYVQPLMARYLRHLDEMRREQGFTCPMLLMLSSGGLTTVDTAVRFPVRLVESGPAGGAIFAASVAQRCELKDVVSFDMGGTTAKICMIDEGRTQTSRTFEVARVYRFKRGSGLPLRIPVVEMVEIGAGGGSIARVDALGRITVGPDSAGSDPGPACYRRGGTMPTVTDADLLMGRIDPGEFAGGGLPLSPDAAVTAMAAGLGATLGIDAPAAAFGISEMVDESMSSATRVHAIESGRTLQSSSLIAFGGAAPLHAARVAEKLGVDHVIIPAAAGVGSAVGFLRAPIAYEVAKTHYLRLSAFEPDLVNRILAEMAQEASAVVGAATKAPTRTLRRAYMRYVGQGHEILIELPDEAFDASSAEALRVRFDREYERVYGRSLAGWLTDVEVASWVVTVTTVQHPDSSAIPRKGGSTPKARGTRSVFDPGSQRAVEHRLYRREDLTAGAAIDGPAIVVENDTSTVVSPAFRATVNAFGDIELERKRSAS
ncbi:MAG: hydantoinase/oxoprolinase family protein [Lautropia sp.]